VGRTAEWTDDVADEITFLKPANPPGGRADHLNDQFDGPGLPVGAANRQRDPLAVLIRSKDDELARPAMANDVRSFDDEAFHLGCQPRCLDDSMGHRLSFFGTLRTYQSCYRDGAPGNIRMSLTYYIVSESSTHQLISRQRARTRAIVGAVDGKRRAVRQPAVSFRNCEFIGFQKLIEASQALADPGAADPHRPRIPSSFSQDAKISNRHFRHGEPPNYGGASMD
jgi:hypothetical protein